MEYGNSSPSNRRVEWYIPPVTQRGTHLLVRPVDTLQVSTGFCSVTR